MNKQEYIDNIFGKGKDKKYDCVNCSGNLTPVKCNCGNNKFYRLLADYLVCSKCFQGCTCDNNHYMREQ